MIGIFITLIICSTILIIFGIVFRFRNDIVNICKHHWEKVDEERIYHKSVKVPEGPNDQRYTGRKIIMQCSKCGEIKTVKIL